MVESLGSKSANEMYPKIEVRRTLLINELILIFSLQQCLAYVPYSHEHVD
jgi:hypothetical protein